MKARYGFISNSSSSSFYIKTPEKHLRLEEIADYYKINPDLPEDERTWLTMCIWQILRNQEKYEERKKTDPEDVDEYEKSYSGSDFLSSYLADDNIEWMQGNDYYKKDPEYWEKAKKLRDSSVPVLSFELASDDGGDFNDYDVKIPWEVRYDIRFHADNAFLDPSVAIGISE